MDRNSRFRGKTAVVTGAGSGIGAAVTEGLLAEGANVLALDVAWKQRPDHRSVAFQYCNVTEPNSVASAFKACETHFGAPDVVFNNAGIGRGGPRLHEVSLEEFEEVLRVNLVGAFIVLKEALAAMLGRGGAIVMTGSTASFMAPPMTGAYAATKGAIVQITKQAALEYAPDKIRVNCVCPGITATPLMMSAPPAVLDKHVAGVPFRRLAKPAEIAGVMLFLGSDEASYVTGAAYVVDGGKIIVTD